MPPDWRCDGPAGWFMRTLLSLRSDLAFTPAEVDILAAAFNRVLDTLGELGLTEKARERVATLIFEEAKTGERDEQRLYRSALLRFGQQSRPPQLAASSNPH